jgi:hypothetical protein
MDDDSQRQPITDAQREEAVLALVREPRLILSLFDRAVDEHDPVAQRIVRDYLRAVTAAFAAELREWERAHSQQRRR